MMKFKFTTSPPLVAKRSLTENTTISCAEEMIF